jgi:hypothetical protein
MAPLHLNFTHTTGGFAAGHSGVLCQEPRLDVNHARKTRGMAGIRTLPKPRVTSADGVGYWGYPALLAYAPG